MWNLKEVKLTEAKSRAVVTRDYREEEMGRYWSRVQSCSYVG